MNITIRPENKSDYKQIEKLVEQSFKYGTEYSNGKVEIQLIKEIRSKEYYIPSLSFFAQCDNKIIGYFMFSKFPLVDKAGNIKKYILLLSPVAVDYKYLRKGIGTKMLIMGIEQAKKLNYDAILVEGNPQFYNTLGFVSSFTKNVLPSQNCHIPSPECLMIMELSKNVFGRENLYVDYSMYDSLK